MPIEEETEEVEYDWPFRLTPLMNSKQLQKKP